jgi:hypothetical protein
VNALPVTLLGCLVFVGITVFEQLPVIGWTGVFLSLLAWYVLTRAIGRAVLPTSVMGAITGFVGALSSWIAQTFNLFGFETLPGDRFGALFGFIGSALGILYWPVVGAGFCALVALLAPPPHRDLDRGD